MRIPDEKGLTVGAVAEAVGVSVRTLHHWEQAGLIHPSGRTSAGYRVYSSADVGRIQRVLVYRELGFPLTEIQTMLDQRGGARDHLARQRDLLAARISHLRQKLSAVEKMMEVHDMGINLSPKEQAEVFGNDWDPAYQEEAHRRWGDTDQWHQSTERTAGFTKQDWEQIKRETDELEAELGAAVAAGMKPGSTSANELAEKHRESIERYYDCTHSMHVLLGRMYVQDERFAAHYDAVRPGLAEWLRDAIAENARAHGVDPETATWQ